MDHQQHAALTQDQIDRVNGLFLGTATDEVHSIYGSIAATFGRVFESAGPATEIRFRVAESLASIDILERRITPLTDSNGRPAGERITFRQVAWFRVDGQMFTAAQMRDANPDDDALLAFVESAQVGDRFPAIVSCERVS